MAKTAAATACATAPVVFFLLHQFHLFHVLLSLVGVVVVVKTDGFQFHLIKTICTTAEGSSVNQIGITNLVFLGEHYASCI